LSRALKLIREHEKYRRKTLNLIPSENILKDFFAINFVEHFVPSIRVKLDAKFFDFL